MAKDPSKTEEATPKRIKKTRSEGNVAKSQEIAKTVSIAAGTLALVLYIPVMYQYVQTIFRRFLGRAHTFELDEHTVYSLFVEVVQYLAALLLPVILCIGIAVWIALRLQVGKLWTTKVFKFNWARFNPINGLKNMVGSIQAFVRLGKSLVQMLIIGYVPYRILLGEMDNFIPLFNEDVPGIAKFMLLLSLKMVAWTLVPMAVLSGIDFWWTKYQYNENLKMTKHEIKDERRQSEGDPAVKAKQRQKMMAMMAKRMLQNVPKADVVVTNPTHIAVALMYDPKESPAPVVLAKGGDHMAEKIKEVARKNNVPIRENVPLARALYKSVEVGDMIPEELYKAVASILAAIWRLKGKTMH